MFDVQCSMFDVHLLLPALCSLLVALLITELGRHKASPYVRPPTSDLCSLTSAQIQLRPLTYM